MFRASLISAIGALAKLIAGFVLIKLIAIIVGPDGLGLMGQFMSLSNVLILLAGGGISTAIIKYVAEYSNDNEKLSGFISSVTLYATVSSLIIFILGFLFSEKISMILFKTLEYSWLIKLLFSFQFGVAVNAVFLSIVSGYRDIVGTNIINVSGTLFGLVLLVPLSYLYNETGLLIGLAIVPATPVFVSFFYIYKKYYFVFKMAKPNYSKFHFVKLSRFSLMLFVTVISMPLVQMLLRNDVVSISNWEVAGYWQAAIRLSDAYLLFINMVLANYYMPKLSELGRGKEQVVMVWRTLLMLAPVILTIVSLIWLLREAIIPMLFSDKFIPSYQFVYFQLVGDFFKMLAYAIGYFVVANAMMKLSIFGDILQAILFYFVASYCMSISGAVGVAEGYAYSYVVYFSLIFFCFCFYSYLNLRRVS